MKILVLEHFFISRKKFDNKRRFHRKKRCVKSVSKNFSEESRRFKEKIYLYG